MSVLGDIWNYAANRARVRPADSLEEVLQKQAAARQQEAAEFSRMTDKTAWKTQVAAHRAELRAANELRKEPPMDARAKIVLAAFQQRIAEGEAEIAALRGE